MQPQAEIPDTVGADVPNPNRKRNGGDADHLVRVRENAENTEDETMTNQVLAELRHLNEKIEEEKGASAAERERNAAERERNAAERERNAESRAKLAVIMDRTEGARETDSTVAGLRVNAVWVMVLLASLIVTVVTGLIVPLLG